MIKTTPIRALDVKVGTALRINGGTWIVYNVIHTRLSVVLDLEGYFATWIGSGKRQLVFRKTDILDSVPTHRLGPITPE